jgi:hypothetical protein
MGGEHENGPPIDVVAICTACLTLNSSALCQRKFLYMCIVYGSQNKLRLFLVMETVFSVRYKATLNIVKVNFRLLRSQHFLKFGT